MSEQQLESSSVNGSVDGNDVEKRRRELEKKLRGRPDFSSNGGSNNGNGSVNGKASEPRVHLVTSVDFPTRFGHFRLYGFNDTYSGKEHTAIVRGDVSGREHCPVRVHSECHTGDVWGSLRCDCRDQLEAAIAFVAEREYGAVIYLRQEGRGIGLLNKIKAYKLQDLGLDTVEANHFLGFPAEARDYTVAARIIELLEIRSISLLSNNPDKIEQLRAHGINVADRIPIVIKPNQHNARYLETKKEKMGHLF